MSVIRLLAAEPPLKSSASQLVIALREGSFFQNRVCPRLRRAY